MHTATAARNRFIAGHVDGASGPRVIVMCFDRLDRDLVGALSAIERNDHYEANLALGHAQDLLSEMALMLDPSLWEHGRSLLSVYDYLLRLLAVANLKKDPGKVREAIRHIAELGGAFRVAATAAPTDATAAVPTSSDAPAAPRRLSVQA